MPVYVLHKSVQDAWSDLSMTQIGTGHLDKFLLNRVSVTLLIQYSLADGLQLRQEQSGCR